MSERRACELLEVDRSSYRYRSRPDRNVELRQRLLELAGERPRFGYRRLWLLLNNGCDPINRKRVHRLYQEAGLRVRRRSRKRIKAAVPSRVIVTGPNQEWAMDFVHDQLATGQRIRTLTIIDSFTRECLGLEVDTSLPSVRVIRALEQIAERRGLPLSIRSDNGPEFTSRRYLAWSIEKRGRATMIQPGKPIENAFIESFNGRFRDECLNVSWFANLNDARRKVQEWRDDYNRIRPHSSLNNQSPDAFRQSWEKLGEFTEVKKEVAATTAVTSHSENHICPW